MSFRIQQVLRTTRPLSVQNSDAKVRPGTRVVVMNPNFNEKVKVKVVDPKQESINGSVIVASESAFKLTARGRPKVAKAPKAIKQTA